MKSDAGKLRNRITLESPNYVQEDGQQVAKWATVRDSIPAEVLGVGGGERVRGKQIEAGIDTVVIARFGLECNSAYPWNQHRFVHESRNLNIVRALDEEGTRKWLTCYCKEVV